MDDSKFVISFGCVDGRSLEFRGAEWRSFSYGTIDFSDIGGWMVKCADYGLELVIKAGLLETE